MSRIATVAAAQMGPIEKDEPRQSTVARMISMMRRAKEQGGSDRLSRTRADHVLSALLDGK